MTKQKLVPALMIGVGVLLGFLAAKADFGDSKTAEAKPHEPRVAVTADLGDRFTTVLFRRTMPESDPVVRGT